MSKFKDFGSIDSKDLEPISFKLWEEDFECVSSIQGKVLLDLVSDSGSDDPVKSAQTMNKFFAAALKKDSLEKFNTLLEDPEKIVTVELLGEIVGWLVEQYSNRPSERPLVS
jgi:hypothetical protein